MRIQYLGHSCFKLTESTGTTVITDPYTKVGYEIAGEHSADAITVSHAHFDHDNVQVIGGNPSILRREGFYQLPGVDLNGIKSYHDMKGGQLRGENIIFKIRMDGLDICHMGDLGEECSAELLEMLK